MSMQLVFACEGVEHPIALTDEHAPRTAAALRGWLPTQITIHCAKIAGCHIYIPTPILAPLEQGTDIHALPAGSFLYYPDRQYLEITYDALQAETAAVNLLGRFEGDLDWFRAFADRQRREHGRRTVTARLSLAGADDRAPAPEPDPDGSALGRLRTARRDAWAAEPDELLRFLERDGLNIPFGPMITAEGEFRRTQEFAWRLWRNANGHADPVRAAMARELLELTLARVVGYCHLEEAGRALEAARAALAEPDCPVEEILAEVTIYCGRMGAWLDLHVPWWEANEITRRNLGRPAG